jgi:chemotaxis protein MotB
VDDEGRKKGAPAWVVTFGDMMSLLLCFFVLLLSFSTMEAEKFKVVAGYLREAFGVQRKHHYTEMPSGQLIVAAGAESSSYEGITLFEKIQVMVTEVEVEETVEAEIADDGVRLKIKGEALFAAGEAGLQGELLAFLSEVAELARTEDVRLIVEGHSDDRPISTARFPSNWELSSARAGAVVRWLTEEGGVPAHRIQAVGYAETRPVAPNDTAEGRAQNRRVEILFEQSGNGTGAEAR